MLLAPARPAAARPALAALDAGTTRWRTRRRACPACAADPGRGTRVLAALPVMTTCGEHGLPLQPEAAVRLPPSLGGPRPPRAGARAPRSAMDRLTWEGLTTGAVTLPGRPVHVGVWLRLLRTLLDEVSIREGRLSRRSAASMARIWEATGRPAIRN